MVSTLPLSDRSSEFCVSCDSFEAGYVLDDCFIHYPCTNVDLCVPCMYEDLST